jgi:4-hydroxy-tetrahydrodipicolinate synthase
VKTLTGVIAATPTPFRVDGAIDFPWVERHLEYLREYGCDGVLIAGTTGEGPSLSLDERKQLIDCVVASSGTMGVIAGCGTPNVDETAAAVRYAIDAGADAALVIPPYYFKDVPAAGLLNYYARLLDRLGGETRICLYNIPQVSGVEISHELLDALLQRYPDRIEGLKDSSGILETTMAYLERYLGLQIWAGGDSLASAVLPRGAYGIMSATAAWAPDLVQDVRNAVEQGRNSVSEQARLDQAERLTNSIDPRSAVKELASIRFGLPGAYVRPPLVDARAEERTRLAEGFASLDLPVPAC